MNESRPADRSAALVGAENGKVWFSAEYRWTAHLLANAKDSAGREFGSKSAFLEMVGLLLPAVTAAAEVAGRHVKLKVDNISKVYAWDKSI